MPPQRNERNHPVPSSNPYSGSSLNGQTLPKDRKIPRELCTFDHPLLKTIRADASGPQWLCYLRAAYVANPKVSTANDFVNVIRNNVVTVHKGKFDDDTAFWKWIEHQLSSLVSRIKAEENWTSLFTDNNVEFRLPVRHDKLKKPAAVRPPTRPPPARPSGPQLSLAGAQLGATLASLEGKLGHQEPIVEEMQTPEEPSYTWKGDLLQQCTKRAAALRYALAVLDNPTLFGLADPTSTGAISAQFARAPIHYHDLVDQLAVVLESDGSSPPHEHLTPPSSSTLWAHTPSTSFSETEYNPLSQEADPSKDYLKKTLFA